MYRFSQTTEILYGHWNEAMAACDELNKLASDKGLRPARTLAPVVGRDNQLVMEVEYDDLAQYDQEIARFYADADLMRTFRKLAEHCVQGSSESSLLMDASHIA